MNASNLSPLVRCRGIAKHYRKGALTVTPLSALDLEVARGEFLALMGPSGSGKTTLLNLLAGIDSPSEGEILVGDTEVHRLNRRRLAAWRARHVGYIFQLYHLIPVLSAFENEE
ncbi:MAG: ATP-binding cassette domain-containing protein, partial [Kiritimatiellia bacterium]